MHFLEKQDIITEMRTMVEDVHKTYKKVDVKPPKYFSELEDIINHPNMDIEWLNNQRDIVYWATLAAQWQCLYRAEIIGKQKFIEMLKKTNAPHAKYTISPSEIGVTFGIIIYALGVLVVNLIGLM